MTTRDKVTLDKVSPRRSGFSRDGLYRQYLSRLKLGLS
ncbi:hypothetical protein GGR71_001604 [Xanthomonas sp. F1]